MLVDAARVHIALLVTVIVGLLFAAGLIDSALAQAGPFGAPRAQTPAVPVPGVLGWIFAKQAEFYRQFSALIRASKADGSAGWSLLGLSFLYGRRRDLRHGRRDGDYRCRDRIDCRSC